MNSEFGSKKNIWIKYHVPTFEELVVFDYVLFSQISNIDNYWERERERGE